MGDEKAVMPCSNPAQIETKGGCWGAGGQYFDVTVVLAMALVKAGYEVVLATPTVDPASDAVAHFGTNEVKGWQ